MKKLLALLITIFTLTSIGFSINIDKCYSEGTRDWECYNDDICICKISGSCSNGRLLVYETDIRTLLCAPKIVNGFADIVWDDCFNPTGSIKIMSDCDEGQTDERTVNIITISSYDSGGGVRRGSRTTTTQVTTTLGFCKYICQSTCLDDLEPPFCYRRISHGTSGCLGGTICCESFMIDCPRNNNIPETPETPPIENNNQLDCPYECCIDIPSYKYKSCPIGLMCCDGICKETCEPKKPSFLKPILFWIILASLIPLLAFFIFILKKNKDQNIPEF